MKDPEMSGGRRLWGPVGKRAEVLNGNLPKQQRGWLQRTQLGCENMGRYQESPNHQFRWLRLGGCGKPLWASFFFSTYELRGVALGLCQLDILWFCLPLNSHMPGVPIVIAAPLLSMKEKLLSR
jgi:hypothetical protein